LEEGGEGASVTSVELGFLSGIETTPRYV
jgi:hypothetical protein